MQQNQLIARLPKKWVPRRRLYGRALGDEKAPGATGAMTIRALTTYQPNGSTRRRPATLVAIQRVGVAWWLMCSACRVHDSGLSRAALKICCSQVWSAQRPQKNPNSPAWRFRALLCASRTRSKGETAGAIGEDQIHLSTPHAWSDLRPNSSNHLDTSPSSAPAGALPCCHFTPVASSARNMRFRRPMSCWMLITIFECSRL